MRTTDPHRAFRLDLPLLLAAALLGGCAALTHVSTEVSSFGDWPADRTPGTYAFERLPSQQAQAVETEALETAARPALERAGFKPAAAGQAPEVLVQVGVRSTRADRQPWDDAFWWRGSLGFWHYGPWAGPSWSLSLNHQFPRYDREVALLIRDRASGKPLFESRAHSEGNSVGDRSLVAALFSAGLMDFPRTGMNPRRVVVPLP